VQQSQRGGKMGGKMDTTKEKNSALTIFQVRNINK
jgi:hypothetical protein